MTTLIIKKNDEPQPGGVVVIPPPASDEPVIKNTFFFPDIDPKRVREGMRLEQTVAPARLREPSKPASPKPMPSCFCGGNSRLPGVLASWPTCRLTISTARACAFSITCALSPQWRPPRSTSVIAALMPAPKATKKPTASIPLSTNCGGTCAGRYRASRTNPAAS